MSLESKIEELTQAINLLRETILMDVRGELTPEQSNPVVELVSAVVEPLVNDNKTALANADSVTSEDEQPEVVDFDTFKAKCLDFARDPKVGKVKVKEVLKDFGAAKASEIKDEDRASVLAKLGEL